MTSYVSRVLEPEEYLKMTNDELYAVITKELYVNEGCEGEIFKSKHRAEYLERAIYVCPECGLSSFTSKRDTIECNRCGRKVRYTENKALVGVDSSFPFSSISEWYDYQSNFVNSFDSLSNNEKPLYEEWARFSEVIPYKKRTLIKKRASLSLYSDKLIVNKGEADEIIFSFDELSGATVLGKNKLNIYKQKQTYQFKGDERFCALKYVNLYFRYRNLSKGDTNGNFLGL